jgi:hypothetical protein
MRVDAERDEIRASFAKLEEALLGKRPESTGIYGVWGLKTNRLILHQINGVRVVR